jgi:chromosomal replication initiation ATPase DnaA
MGKRLLECLANLYDITSADILGKCRKAHISEARMIFIYLMRHLGYSTTYLGELLNRNHATMIYNTKTFDNRYKYDVRFRKKVDKMLEIVDLYGEKDSGKVKKERQGGESRND